MPSASFTVSWDGRLVDPPKPAELKRFRKLAATGLPAELRLTFRPCILGGQSAPPITGLEKAFLPRGTALRLLKLERTPGGITASYRLQTPIAPILPIPPIPVHTGNSIRHH